MRTGRANHKPSLFNRIPVILLVLFLFAILTVALYSRAEYCGYKYGDSPAWVRQDIPSLLMTVGVLFCLSIMVYNQSIRLHLSKRKYVTGNILYLSMAVQVLYILLLPANQFADQNIVNGIAQDLINGNYRAFQKGGYLYQYPNNIGITLILSLVYRLFPQSMLVPKLLNAVFSTTTSFLIMRIYEESNPGRRNRSYGILLISGFFLPMILLNNLVYNDLFATTLFVGATYYAIRFSKSKKWQHLLCSGLLISLGNFLRQLGTIFLIAVTLFLILRKVKPVRILVFFGMVIILCRLPLTVVNQWLLNDNKMVEPLGRRAVPIQMWIHMGMNEERFGYWDNSYSYNIYLRQGEKSEQIFTDLIKKNLQGKRLLKTAKVYVKKNLWLWTEGTYQAEYYGIGSWGYLYQTFATRYFQYNTPVRDWVRWIMHATNYLIFLLALYGLASTLKDRKSYPLILPAIILLGFIGFYTLWEIKPRYIYPIYPYLILMSYYGLSRMASRYFRNGKYSEDPAMAKENRLTGS